MTKVEVIKANTYIKNSSVQNKKKKVCGYARVSTDSKEQINSYKSQITHYTKLIKENPNWEFTRMYADEGVSGTRVKNRVQFQKMIEDAFNGKIDMIIAKSISRFARNTMDTLKYIRKLREKNIDVYFEKENIHTLNLDSEMFLTLYSAFAQAESESTSMNVKMGLKAKMKKGEYCGQANPFGYTWNKKTKKLEINKQEAPTVKMIFELYEKGFGAKKIAQKLNELGLKPRIVDKWDTSKVIRVIKNEKYVGDLLGQKYYVTDPITHKKKTNFGEKERYYAKDVHQPIISRTLWNQCQEIYKIRCARYFKDGSRHTQKYSMRYPFSSMIECGFCKGNYIRKVGGKSGSGDNVKRVSYWRCTNIVSEKKECQAKHSIREVYLKDIFNYIFNYILANNHSNQDHLFNLIKEVLTSENTNNLNNLIKEKEKYEERLSHLIDLKLDNYSNVNVYTNKENEINNKLKDINSQIENLSKSEDKGKINQKQLKNIKEMLNKTTKLEEFDEDIFKILIKKIIIGDYENGIFNFNIVIFVLNIDEESIIKIFINKGKIENVSYYGSKRTCRSLAIFKSKIHHAR